LTLEGGKWEVGLTDIQFSQNWTNVPESTISVTSDWYAQRSEEFEEVKLPAKNYAAMILLIRDINVALRLSVRGKTVIFSYNHHTRRAAVRLHKPLPVGVDEKTMLESVGMSWDSYNRINAAAGYRIDVTARAPHFIEISKKLAQILGFENNIFYATTIGTKPASLSRDFTNMYVYADVVADRHIGDIMAPLLRVVPVETYGHSYKVVHKEFRNVHFHNVRNTKTDIIHVRITNDQGRTVNFDGGKVVINLQFRPRA
jgi:hypothetical protein